MLYPIELGVPETILYRRHRTIRKCSGKEDIKVSEIKDVMKPKAKEKPALEIEKSKKDDKVKPGDTIEFDFK